MIGADARAHVQPCKQVIHAFIRRAMQPFAFGRCPSERGELVRTDTNGLRNAYVQNVCSLVNQFFEFFAAGGSTHRLR